MNWKPIVKLTIWGMREQRSFSEEILRQRGDIESARDEYNRAEARGHPEAAMSLRNLLAYDVGDREGAKAAHLRSIEMGSTMALLNLGLVLAEDGDHDEALGYLRRAADAGDSHGYWGIGKIYELRQRWDDAAEAYRHGAALGDAASAFGLGMSLLEQGDNDGARAAFEHALELGHDGVAHILAAFDREEGRSSPGDVVQLWSNVTAVYDTLASHRQELGRQWIASTLVVEEQDAKLAALNDACAELHKRFTTISRRFNSQPLPAPWHGRAPMPARSPDEWLRPVSGQAESWVVVAPQRRAVEADLEEARTLLEQAEHKTFGGGLRKKGEDALRRVAAGLDELKRVIEVAESDVVEARRSRDSEARATAERLRDEFESTTSLATSSAAELPAILQPWSSPSWDSWSLDDERSLGLQLAHGGVLLPKQDERLGVNAEYGTDLRVPWGFCST